MNDPTAKVAEARAFALRAHGEQRYGTVPYAVHLDAVVEILRRHGYASDDHLAAGYLHDVLEDTEATREMLAAFGASVVQAVAFCSDEPGETRKQRKRATYARMARQVVEGEPWVRLAVRVKVADRLANVMASAGRNPAVPRSERLLALYRREHPTFAEALRVAGVCDGMWVELDALLGT